MFLLPCVGCVCCDWENLNIFYNCFTVKVDDGQYIRHSFYTQARFGSLTVDGWVSLMGQLDGRWRNHFSIFVISRNSRSAN